MAKSLLAALREYMGYLPGQNLRAFGDELKKLTDKDRADFVDMFKAIGWNVVNMKKKK